ncbi:MFS transporter [Bradyrhizobium sp. LHD-71]|uniref:MFS transporter n=1 Tax=Bradyrhizobium sp. LHD-71 TaxID=3072141 RepID=UPI00280CF328|nr:MFS transporter [Bradyrhizobium sp. LHD-71]MDQ8728791.1 MFS transporter [Bradyrhizobium sp. LHD-71]
MAPPSHAMQYLLPIIAMGNFAAGLTSRVIDPVVPQISEQLAVNITTAATLASASAIAFAFVQLPLGMVADLFGKPKVILTCLIVLGIANIVGSYTDSFELLLATRVICGLGAGGVFPVAMGLTGDLFPVEKRRVAMSRIMAGALTGNLLGASFSGVLGDLFGWRGVLSILGSFILVMSLAVAWGFRNQLTLPGKPVNPKLIAANYRRILSHPNAHVCYLGVFVEGICIFGMLPYVASFLADLGEPRLSIAGLVIGGYAVGGLFYAATVTRLLARFGDNALMVLGAIFISSQIAIIAFGPPWQVQFVNFVVMGCGFYLIHGGFQVFTSEIAPDARASAVSLQAFCFNCGQFSGPLLYGFGLTFIGKVPTLLTAAALLLSVGILCAKLLRHRHPPDIGPKDKPASP